ncbi:hypothetical protein [Streptomyces sp. NPDC059651]|uniref:hypothetical protein n=1 Tax=Streptomyces sp. NPDC059651 TaxID=3346897 RepID=UPI0036D0C6AE
MTGTPREEAAVLPRRAADTVRGLGVRFVLLAFWGTPAVLSRWCGGERGHAGESVRRKV